MKSLSLVSTLVLVAATAPSGHATPGDRDSTFGTDGIVTTPFVPTSFCGATGLVLQSDGKIVTGGYASNGSNHDFALVRYLVSGALDTSFDSDGKVTTAIGTGDDLATATALQSDGKIVLAGYSSNGSNNDMALVRYLPDGSLDTGFGGTGKVITAIGSGDDRANDVAVQSDGKIVVVGYTHNGSNLDIALVRYNTDGSLDTSFGTGGKVTTAAGSGDDTANSMAIQPDGKIVVAASISGQFGVVRYLGNGTLDSAFDADGQVVTDFASASLGSATEVALQSDGKILVSGWGWNGSIETASFHAMARYNSDGSLDPGFSGDGMAVPGVFNSSSGMAIQSDGKILVGDGGNVGGGGQSIGGDPARIARFNANGTLDGSFAGGIVAAYVPGPGDATSWVGDIAVQSDGRIVVAGSTEFYDFFEDTYEYTFLSLRYEGAPEAGADIRVEQPADTTLSDGSSTINFGIINATSSRTRTFTIRNDGLSTLTGLAISVDGTNAASFVPGAIGSTTLAANASTTFDVTFTPGTTGSKTANLHIASNDPNENPFDIALTGTGSIPDIAVQKWPNAALTDGSSTVDFGSVGFTVDSLVRFQIYNYGSADLDNISATVDGPNAADFVIVSAPVNATISGTGSLQVLVSFRPSLAGSRTATLHITSNDPDEGSFDIALTGTGRALTAWDRDPGFGAFGRVVTPLVDPFPTYRAASIKLQSDGKFIVLASPGVYVSSGGPTPESRFHLLRYLPGGALDATFGSGGLVTTDVGTGSDTAQDAVLQTDRKIVVAGSSGGKFALTRYTTAGALDSSFDGDGIATTSIGTGCTGRSVLIQPDGKLIVAGYATVSGASDFALARYLPDGSLDATFGTGGIVTMAVGTSTDEATSMLLQPDGKIVIAGHSQVGTYYDFALVRCNADGSLDGSFGSGGKVIVSMGPRNDFCSSCALYPDGRIVIGGISYDASFNTTWQIARFTSSGVLDNTLDGDGKLGLSPAGGGGGCNSLKVQADGKLLAAGRSDLDPAPFISNYDFVTLRLLDNGGLDTSFGSSGIVSTDFAYDDEAFSMWQQPDGQLLVAGSSNGGMAFARYAETPGSPEIVVEEPAGTDLTDNSSSVTYSSIALGGTSLKTFTIRNAGTADLTGLAVTKDGGNSGDYSVGALGAATLAPGASTSFTVTFAPADGTSGTRNAAIHISSNDANENPFDIALTGQAFSTTADVDGDGMNDWSEYQMSALGFDWQVSNTALVNTYFATASGNGLYTTSQVQALNVGVPLLQRNPSTGAFTLTIGVEKSTTLAPGSFAPFPFSAPQTIINGQGKIEFQFTVPDNAAFFRLQAQ